MGSREVDLIEKGGIDRLGEVAVGDGRGEVKIPTNLDTWNQVVRRLGNVKLRDVDVRDLWRKRDAWGTYEPNAVVVGERERRGE